MLLDKLAFTKNKYEELSVKISDKAALSSVIATYSVINVLLGIMVFTMYKEPEFKRETKAIIDVKALKKVLSLPTTWLQCCLLYTSRCV